MDGRIGGVVLIHGSVPENMVLEASALGSAVESSEYSSPSRSWPTCFRSAFHSVSTAGGTARTRRTSVPRSGFSGGPPIDEGPPLDGRDHPTTCRPPAGKLRKTGRHPSGAPGHRLSPHLLGAPAMVLLACRRSVFASQGVVPSSSPLQGDNYAPSLLTQSRDLTLAHGGLGYCLTRDTRLLPRQLLVLTRSPLCGAHI
jgi:hypothetical protein